MNNAISGRPRCLILQKSKLNFLGGQPLAQGHSENQGSEPVILAHCLVVFSLTQRLPLNVKECEGNWHSFGHSASNYQCASLVCAKKSELTKDWRVLRGHFLSSEPAPCSGSQVCSVQSQMNDPIPWGQVFCPGHLPSLHSKWEILLSGKTGTSEIRDKKREGFYSVSPLSDLFSCGNLRSLPPSFQNNS